MQRHKVRKGQEVLGKSDFNESEVRLCPILAVQYRNAISLSGLFPYLEKVGMIIRLISLLYCEDFVTHVTCLEMYLLPH